MSNQPDNRVTVTIQGGNADDVTRKARRLRAACDWLAPDMSIGKVGNLHTVTMTERSGLEQVSRDKDGKKI